MTYFEMLGLARVAGFRDDELADAADNFVRLIQLAAMAERKRCADRVYTYIVQRTQDTRTAQGCAAALRAGGDK